MPNSKILIAGMSMQKVSFYHCALSYLDMWLREDRGYCQALSTTHREHKLTALGKAAFTYRIARNFPDKYDRKQGLDRYGPVLDILDSLDAEVVSSDGIVQTIEHARKRISSHYGGRDVLSATTKFLWLKFKSPVVIYDSQARLAIGTRAGDIGAYLSAWQKRYATHEQEIEAACEELPSVQRYCENQETPIEEIQYLSRQKWFKERVLDVYLWNIGNG
jgi:hypothetical protein